MVASNIAVSDTILYNFPFMQVENIRRKHNYLPLIMELLKVLAKQGNLVPLVEKVGRSTLNLSIKNGRGVESAGSYCEVILKCNYIFHWSTYLSCIIFNRSCNVTILSRYRVRGIVSSAFTWARELIA